MLDRFNVRAAVCGIVLALSLYWGAAYTRYRFLHPELTETQLLLHIGDILKWRD